MRRSGSNGAHRPATAEYGTKDPYYAFRRYFFHRHSYLKMLRSLKKCLKPPPNPTPPENPTHQTTNVDAERDRDPEGENRPRKISELMSRMGPILPRRRYQLRGDYPRLVILITPFALGLRVRNGERGIESQKLPTPNGSTPIPGHEGNDTSECSWPGQRANINFLPDRTARTRWKMDPYGYPGITEAAT